MTRSSKKGKDQHVVSDSDQQFAFIAGQTEGGASYGITWEESEEIEAGPADLQRLPPPEQKTPVSLKQLAQEMQMGCDAMTVYYQRSSGEFFMVSDEHALLVEEEDDFEDRPAWEQEAIEQAATILLSENDGDYVALPSQFDIHEYSIMKSFCHTVKSSRTADDLFRSISGKGAFRRFKDAIHRHGIQQEWYNFKDESFRDIARDWCEENGIVWQE